MAVLVDLHVIAGADPGTVLYLFVLIWIETTRTQRPSNFVDILGQTKDDLLSDAFNGGDVSTRFFRVLLNEDPHALDCFFAWLLFHLTIFSGTGTVHLLNGDSRIS
jgi:hypothetical protein